MITSNFRFASFIVALSICAIPAPCGWTQDVPDRIQVSQLERLQPPGVLPRIERLTPTGPDGVPYLRPGETFVVLGSAFSSVPGQTRIGIRTWVAGQATIPPQQADFIASVKPAKAFANRLEAVAPSGIATGRYLMWVYVEGAGHSVPVEFHYSNPEKPTGMDPRISHVKPGYPDLETVIQGVNFGPGAMVQWPIGLAQVATYVNSTTIKTRIPKGLKPGLHQVRVEVDGRWSNTVSAQVVEPKPLNLHWDRTDRNGIPLNPRWGRQLTHEYGKPGYYPKPTNWLDISGILGEHWDWSRGTDQALSYDNGWFGCGPHVSWDKIPVTFTGYWRWSHKSLFYEDDDYNFVFFPSEGAGATDRGDWNPGGIMTEFDAGATVEHFKTSWWREFRDAVNDESFKKTFRMPLDKPEKTEKMASGKYGIVTGRWGLDCAHDCYAEIHPVWAMALLAEDDPYDDLWVMFLRPWGDQGFCGNKNHTIRFRTENGKEIYTFELPWRPGAVSVKPTHEFLCRKACSLTIKPVQGEAVLVVLSYPAGMDKQRINGQLRLAWSYPQGAAPGFYEFAESARINVNAAMAQPIDPGNSEYWKAMEKLSTDQQNAINQQMRTVLKKPSASRDHVAIRIDPTEVGLALAPVHLPQIATEPDQTKVQRMNQIDTFARSIGVTTVKGTDLQLQTSPGGSQLEPARPAPSSPPTVLELENAPHRGDRPLSLDPETNRPGHDYRNFSLEHAEPELCREACAVDERCRAYTYVRPGVQGERAHCWLKSESSPAEHAPYCVSGAKE